MLAIDGCHVATVDAAGTEYPDGLRGDLPEDRIAAVGPRAAARRSTRRPSGSTAPGLLATPGLVNTHHHLYQWITRGYATDAHAVRLADHAVPGLGRAGRRSWCTRPRRPTWAGWP